MMVKGFRDPPREFSAMPFWFWNDDLDEQEILRQIADFEAHGVYGFVIHPRVGLPRDIGWMSDRMLHFVRVAVDEAQRRNMYVILYDEGMYPSGSSSGQVVAHNPAYHCRCLARVELSEHEVPHVEAGQNLVAVVARANGQRIAVIDRPVDAYIRGLHYIGEGPAEDEPPAADLLNPDAVATFIHLVYDRYAEALRGHGWGTTVLALFTDEPGLLGRSRERDVMPGTTGILEHVNAFLGYDFTPHLPILWYDDEPDAQRYRRDYRRAIIHRLEETYYRQLFTWCEAHHIALTGHPARGDQIGPLRYFHIPGQDIVWRWVLPNHPSALEGPESTQAKCSASAMLHSNLKSPLGHRRNSNECFGAYGHGFTWEEMKWLVDWCFVRGVNLLYPHAFYYSMRGCRKDERPPDVGPHSPWWEDYQRFADYCRRMSWLNTDSEHVCHVAILGEADHLPWAAAKVCFEHQIDFNYLEVRHLWEKTGGPGDCRTTIDPTGIHIAGMHYQVLIIDAADGAVTIPEAALPAIKMLREAGRVITWQGDSTALVTAIAQHVAPDITVDPPHPDLRYRHVIKASGEDGAGGRTHYYMLCNEGIETIHTHIQVSTPGDKTWVDPLTMKCWRNTDEPKEPAKGHESAETHRPMALTLKPYTLHILKVEGQPAQQERKT